MHTYMCMYMHIQTQIFILHKIMSWSITFMEIETLQFELSQNDLIESMYANTGAKMPRHVYQHNSGTTVLAASNSILIWLKANLQEETHAVYAKTSKNMYIIRI